MSEETAYQDGCKAAQTRETADLWPPACPYNGEERYAWFRGFEDEVGRFVKKKCDEELKRPPTR